MPDPQSQDPLEQIPDPDPQDDGIWELPAEGEPDLTEEDELTTLLTDKEDQSIHVIPEEGEEVEGEDGAKDPLAAEAKEGEEVAAPEEGEAIAGEEAEAETETTAAADDPPAAPSGWDEYAQSTQDVRGDRSPEEFAKQTAEMFRAYLDRPDALIKDIIRLNPDITPDQVFPQLAQAAQQPQPQQTPQPQAPEAKPGEGPLNHILKKIRYSDEERQFMTDADKAREEGWQEMVSAVERLGMEVVRTRGMLSERDGQAAKSQFDYFRDAVDQGGQKVHPFATNRQVAAKMRILAQHDDAFRQDGAAPTAQDFSRIYNEAVWLVPQVRSQLLAKKQPAAPPKAPQKQQAAPPRTPPKPQTKQVRLPNAGGRFSKKGRPARLQIGSGFAEVPLGIAADQDQDLEAIFKAALQSGHIQ